MSQTVHKVTCFITRPGDRGTDLLLFRHPDAGVQIPAGTVEPGETPEAAAMREATEESGLTGLVLLRYLGEVNEPPPAGHMFVVQSTPVYSRPRVSSLDWAHFRTGLPVEVLRHEGGFTQVRYEEPDRFPDPQYATYNITGWVPDEALTDRRTRHFYLFSAPAHTPENWPVATDNHVFELVWAPLDDLPPIVPPQDGWLKYL
jgi:8-oxo-dGTP pyrophosphatase MutT (NUDIX family)